MPKTNFPFATQPELVSISIAYRNMGLIADSVLPRIPVGKEEYRYNNYPKGMFITVPDTKAGRKSKLNEANFEGDEVTGATKDYGLQSLVPQKDIDNAPEQEGMDPLSTTTEGLRDLILLDREVRVANKVFAAATYAAENKVQLAGNDQWSDFVNSDPIKDIEEALNIPFMRPNTMTIGQGAWSVLRRHPKILKAVHKNDGDSGLASREAVAELFELKEVNVGQGWVNIAKPGQPVVRARVWGKHCLLHYKNTTANLTFGMTFGFTPQHGAPVAGTKTVDPGDAGLSGGTMVINGEKVNEEISAPDLAYFFEDCVA